MIIKCSSCNKQLIEAVSMGRDPNENDLHKKLLVKCPYCMDQSYQYDVENRYSIRPLDDLELLDVDDKNQKNNKVIVYLAETV